MVCVVATTQQCFISQAALLRYRSEGLVLARLGQIKPQFSCPLIACPRQNWRKWPKESVSVGHFRSNSLGRTKLCCAAWLKKWHMA